MSTFVSAASDLVFEIPSKVVTSRVTCGVSPGAVLEPKIANSVSDNSGGGVSPLTKLIIAFHVKAHCSDENSSALATTHLRNAASCAPIGFVSSCVTIISRDNADTRILSPVPSISSNTGT